MLEWVHFFESGLAQVDLLGRPGARALLAAVTSFLLVLLFGHWFIRFLRSRRVLEQTQRGDCERLDSLHASKGSTPTLGGVVLFSCVVASTILWARPGERLVQLLLAYVIGLAVLGFVDDTKKLRTKKGLSAKAKMRVQLILSFLAGWYLYAAPLDVTSPALGKVEGTSVFLPFLGDAWLPLGAFFILLVGLVTTSASNAVNLTDGLDGLAAGCSVLVSAVFLVVALASGSVEWSAALRIPFVEGASEVGVFVAALLGGGLGFLWFNCHPARIFMGDTGALPLGGSLGLVAVLLKQEALLVLVGGVLVVEALSVILQVASFKLRRKRIFLIAPLHHHFQFKGWPETRITTRFWIAGAILAFVSLLALGL